MKNLGRTLWGLVLVALGVVIGINSLGIAHIDIFFDGWWTLFIIVPCLIGVFTEQSKTGNIIGLVIGVTLLLSTRGLISFELVAKLIIPFILVVVGISLIFNDIAKKNITSKMKEMNQNDMEHIVATFAEQKVLPDGEFKGSNLDAVFGGVFLDLRGAKLEKETFIKASSIFGGIDIIVPGDVNVQVKSTPIFGGVSNKIVNKKDNKKTIYIDAFCMFGGVDIK